VAACYSPGGISLGQRMAQLFALRHLRHAYNGHKVVRLDDGSVAQGEDWLILGPSGSGYRTDIAGVLARR
jgi:ABC-type molybdenum transport system ATPase subunit/photorepair protein PhrA